MKSLLKGIRKSAKYCCRRAPIPTEIQEKFLFFCQMGYWPNFDSPQSFAEKLHARKLTDRNEAIAILSDKLGVRDYVTDRVGSRYLVPLLYSGDRIDADLIYRLGNDIVVKRNDDSGSSIVLRQNTRKHADAAYRRITRARDYGESTNEWWYRKIPSKYLVEKLLSDARQTYLPVEYKFFMFGSNRGPHKMIVEVLKRNRAGTIECSFFDSELNRICYNGHQVSYRGSKPLSGKFPGNAQFKEMRDVAFALSERLNFVRVDLYAVNGRVYFSELTFNPAEGRFRVTPPEFDYELGRNWEMPILIEKGLAA